MCNLYHVKGSTEPTALIDQLKVPRQGVLWSDEWVVPFTRPWMPLVLGQPRQAALGSWTLMPPWVKPDDPVAVKKQSGMTANARSETMFELASFRRAARTQRCLVLATAYREWQWQDPKGKTKIPHTIAYPGETPFFMAGLWTEWHGELTFTIVTKPANALMRTIHNGVRSYSGEVDPRMPVVVPPDDWELWLAGGERAEVEHLFVPHDDDGLTAEPVRKADELDL